MEKLTNKKIINTTYVKVTKEKGITLIALVITVIVLLILAGVTITTLLGDNGIITNATKAKEKTNIANLKEMVQAEILGCQSENNGYITGEQLKEILNKYFDGVPESVEDLEEALKDSEYTLKANDEYGGKSVEVKLSEIYDGKLGNGMLADEPTGPVADTGTSYVGYYADVNGDGTEDGIIYADLAVGGEGKWGSNLLGNYKYTAETGQLKTYTIGDEVASAKFGTAKKPVISAVPGSTGKDRFYVMALEDVDTNSHTWYKNAYGKLPSGKLTEEADGRIVEYNYNDFGTGKENTNYWLGKYGKIDGATEDSNDMWKIIQSDENKAKYPLETWFVPSMSEWSAFGDMLFKSEAEGGFGITKGNQGKFGLNGYYWSSSQYDTRDAYETHFIGGSIFSLNVNGELYVRLSATF